jgi:hypothetical protein
MMQQRHGAATTGKHRAHHADPNDDDGQTDDEGSGLTGGSHRGAASTTKRGRKANTTISAPRRYGDEELHAREVVCFTHSFETERAFFDLCGPAMCMQLFASASLPSRPALPGAACRRPSSEATCSAFLTPTFFGIATGVGIASVFDTLCTQEHGKVAHSPMQGFHVRCAAVVCVGFSALYALSCVTIGRALTSPFFQLHIGIDIFFSPSPLAIEFEIAIIRKCNSLCFTFPTRF